MDGNNGLLNSLIEAAGGLANVAVRHLPTASFDGVDKKGRIDWLASVLIEKTVQQKAPHLSELHGKLKPVINGFLKERLGK